MLGIAEADLRAAYKNTVKQERYAAVDAVKAKVMAALFPADAEPRFDKDKVASVFKDLQAKIVRWNILDTGGRIDGRDLKTVRPIVSEVGVLPRTHGSALFTRGETQALVVATLGTGEDEQMIDSLEGTYKVNFMLHYNFPPYSVGEAGRMGSPGRREIGHGKLAWRAIRPILPASHEFPYTMRVVSEITESNGSSSMATVCGTSLALMDAGVPLKAPVAGIAMGLIKEGDRFAVLSDILGDEDHLGDMDFKVAGTANGITSLQMDIKIQGITEEIMKTALDQAKDGRLHILGEMSKALGHARAELGEHAPRIEVMKIPVDKIREVIGSGGKVIREIVEKTGAKIDIEDDGTIKVASANAESIRAAMKWIQGIAAEPEPGHDLSGHRREDRRLRRLRELLRLARRPRARLAARAAARRQRQGRGEGRRQGLGQVPGRRRARQGAPVDEGRRPEDRPGDQERRSRRLIAATASALAQRERAVTKRPGERLRRL